LIAAFLIARFRFILLCTACWDFSFVCSTLLIRTSHFGVFRLCGGDKGSALDLRGLLAPRPSPAWRRWTRDLRPHFCLAFHFAPLRLLFALTQKLKCDKIRVYFSGDNLFTITPYKGCDPERAGDGNDAQYPQNKVYSFGVNINI